MSKWIECFSANNITASDTIAKLIDVSARFGIDNGVKFKSIEFKDYTKCNGIKFLTRALYHAQIDGVTKKFSSILNILYTELTRIYKT